MMDTRVVTTAMADNPGVKPFAEATCAMAPHASTAKKDPPTPTTTKTNVGLCRTIIASPRVTIRTLAAKATALPTAVLSANRSERPADASPHAMLPRAT